MGVPRRLRKRMEVPEWVHIVSHGTSEELREFIRANPGFDWDRTVFDKKTAFAYIWKNNAFPLCALQTLRDLGGATFSERYCEGAYTPLEVVAMFGSTMIVAQLLQWDVNVDSPAVLECSAEVREMILDHSTTLTKDIVNRALTRLDTPKMSAWIDVNGPADELARNSFLRWLVSHTYRRDASVCVAWTLSQLTGTQWPDMSEGVARRLMETRVRDW
jgi:hypothetical protein